MLTQAIHYAATLAIRCYAGDTLLCWRYAAMLAIRYAPILLILRWKGGGLGAQPPAS